MRADSQLGLYMPEVHLFHSERKFKRFVKRLTGKKAKTFGTEGQMCYYCGIVAVLMTHEGQANTEVSLLVHEAYHAAVAHMRWLNEGDAGEETMAYLVQSISDGLFCAHGKWKRKHG